MGNLLTYSGITTKIKAMESRLLTLEDYQHISQLESTAEFISYLKQQSSYKDIFANSDERSLHRGQIEPILSTALYLEFEKVYRFATQEQRSILSFVFFRYEVNILKSCLQQVFQEQKAFDLSLFAPFFNQHSKLKVEALSTSNSIDEFVTHLQGSEYYSFFMRMRNNGMDSLYDLEAQLDIYYFQKVWKLKNRLLKGRALKSITKLIGSRIDLLNIMWIYRSKKFYDVDMGKIYATIIPCNYKLKKVQLTKLVESANVEEFTSILSTTFYQPIAEKLDPKTIETMYEQSIRHIYQKTKQKEPYSMVPILCFLHEKEQEIDRLTTALECIRYRLEPEEILNFIQAV